MKNLLFLTILFASLPMLAQNLSLTEGTTRAVVIGISDYQNEDIPDLRFADKDAEAFATYLQSSAGGNLPDENIRLLLNEKATQAAMVGELDWLMEESQEGDLAIIYFSGHGDVESKMARQPGFLLTYDSPPKVYMLGAYPLFYLQLIIETLSTEKNVKTIVISDACRAGKLAGSEIGGTQATASNLAKQYANEIKILSCQPDEFSLEGEQWGGGRGAFSYHLIEGLIGLADKNDNLQVNLLEIENYLEEKVPEETAPQSQIPLTVGSKGTAISFVDSDILAELKSLKERELPALAAIESRGIEETLLSEVDTLIQIKYDAFIAALNDENLLDSKNGKPSADQLYRALIKEESLADLHRFMTRQYATALQNDAQQVINAYILSTPSELRRRWNVDTTYGRYPRYLERAAELLGKEHYIYDYLIAKKLYFEGLNLRLKGDLDNRDNFYYKKAVEKQKAAIELENRAAYFYNELGLLHTHLKLDEKAFEYYEKAIELAPEWGLPYVNYCIGLFYNGQQEKAIEYGEKALKYLPDFPHMYNFLAWIHANDWSWKDKTDWDRQGIELRSDFYFGYDDYSSNAQRASRYIKSIELLDKAIEIDSLNPQWLFNLGFILVDKNRSRQSVSELERGISLLEKASQYDSLNARIFASLGHGFGYIGEYERGEKMFLKAIQLAKENYPYWYPIYHLTLGNLYASWDKKDLSIEYYQKASKINPNYSFAYGNTADIYREKNELQLAEWNGLKAMGLSSSANFKLSLAWTYNAMKRYEDQEWMLLKAIEQNPKYTLAMMHLAGLYSELNLTDKALKWRKKILEIIPEDSYEYRQAGREAYLNKEFVQAEKYFQQALKLDSLNEDRHNWIGLFYRFHSEFEKAKPYLLKAIELNPSKRQPYVNLAFIHYDEGLEEEGDKWLDSGWENSRDPLVFDFKMVLALYKEDYENAHKHLDSLLSYDETYKALPPIINALKQKDYQLADSLIDKVPRYLRNLRDYFRARVQVKLGNYLKAIELLGQQGMLIPYRMAMRDTFLNPLQKMPAFQQGLRQFFPEKFDDLDDFDFKPPEPVYYTKNCADLANYYFNKGEKDRANFLFKKAIEFKPDTLSNEEAMALAIAHTRLGDYQKAKSICPDSIQTNTPEETRYYARAFYKFSKPQSAETYFQKYVQSSEDELRFRKVAWAYHDYGEEKLAEKYLRKSLEHYPEAYYAYWDLGMLYFNFRKYEKAVQVMEEGIQRYPKEVSLKGMQALFIGLTLSPSELDTSSVFKNLEAIIPDFSKVGTYLTLVKQKKYPEAHALYEDFKNIFSQWWIPRILKLSEVRMLVAEKEYQGAMDILNKRDFWIFNYEVLRNDPELEPLRATKEFQEFIKNDYPEKIEK